jgi:(2Fe-2S) ferredoxin
MAAPRFEHHVFVCVNRRDPGHDRGSCAERNGEEVCSTLKSLVRQRGTKGRIRVNAAGCLDQCPSGVTMVVYPEQTWYGHVRTEDLPELVEQHLIGGVPVERLRLK